MSANIPFHVKGVAASTGALDIVTSTITPQNIKSWYCCQYTLTADLPPVTAGGEIYLPGLSINGPPYWNPDYDIRPPNLPPIFVMTTTQSIIKVQVSGTYNIHYRLRPDTNNVSSDGANGGPYLLPITYLGQAVNLNGNSSIPYRLSSSERFMGSTTVQSTIGDTSIQFTGLLLAGDQIALCYSSVPNANQYLIMRGNIGTRITCSLISPITTAIPSATPYLATLYNINSLLSPTAILTYQDRNSLPDNNHAWLVVFNNVDHYAGDQIAMDQGSDLAGSLSTVTKSGPLPPGIIVYSSTYTTIYGKKYLGEFFIVGDVNAGSLQIYSGWVRAGTSSQCVGCISRRDGGHFIVSAYGLTSVSPVAKVNGVSTILVTPATGQSVQQWIIGNCPSSDNVSFLYDASIGTNGRITWLSYV